MDHEVVEIREDVGNALYLLCYGIEFTSVIFKLGALSLISVVLRLSYTPDANGLIVDFYLDHGALVLVLEKVILLVDGVRLSAGVSKKCIIRQLLIVFTILV